MALGGLFDRFAGLTGARRWAVLASLVWVVVVLAYGIGFLSVAAGTQTRGTVFLDAMFFLVALVLPLGLVWLTAWLAEELARQREIVAALAEVTAPLIGALGETRTALAHASPEAIAQAVGSAVGEAMAGVRPPDVSQPLSEIAAGQARLQAALARLAAHPAAEGHPPAPPASAGAAAGRDPTPEPPPEPTQPATPLALGWEQLVRALDFPRDATDREGFRALKAAQKQPKLGQTLQAAEDVLNLLSREGIFVDELAVAEVEPSAWRRFMAGVRGAKVGAVGGITDPRTLEVVERLMRADSVFRDAALFFQRRFERLLAEHARDADDNAIAALAGTRSGRAFMILARASGTVT